MSDTPRTEALLSMEFDYGRQIGTITENIVVEFCRQLERELDAMTADRDALADLLKAGQRP